MTAIDPGHSAHGLWHLTGDEDFFRGHFPGRPTLPGVLMVEAMAQLGGIAALSDRRFEGYLPLFGGIDKARFRRQVVPGDTLELAVELDQLGSTAGKGHGTASVGGKVAAAASMLFVMVRGLSPHPQRDNVGKAFIALSPCVHLSVANASTSAPTLRQSPQNRGSTNTVAAMAYPREPLWGTSTLVPNGPE